MTRVVIGVDLPSTPDALIGGEHWLTILDAAVQFGLGDAFGFERPVQVVKSLVTDPSFEAVVVRQRLNPFGPSLTLSWWSERRLAHP